MRPAPNWLRPEPGGLWCEPGGFFIDPTRASDRAVITHGHADHARPGHGKVLATPETLAIMRDRHGERAGGALQPARYGEPIRVGDVTVTLRPAGHILGSAQAVLDHRGERIVVSGDYKRRDDPTCRPFEPVPCDLFVTEATFALPVFRHPDDGDEIARLLEAREAFPDRAILVGAYSLGKAQRILALLRRAGYERPIYTHGSLDAINATYRRFGVELGTLRGASGAPKAETAGELVIAPPSALGHRWSRHLAEPLICMASGWMRVRARARRRGVELPLAISDHADWDELNATVDEVGAPHLWVTHGAGEALVHAAGLRGFEARPLGIPGHGEEAR